MRYLLDTQIIIWALENNTRIPKAIRTIIDDSRENMFITVVSLWEIAIKRSIGKLDLNYELIEIHRQPSERGASILPITVKHLTTNESLQFIDKHRDPFDRLIISQAMTEDMTIITSDPYFEQYSVPVLWQ